MTKLLTKLAHVNFVDTHETWGLSYFKKYLISGELN